MRYKRECYGENTEEQQQSLGDLSNTDSAHAAVHQVNHNLTVEFIIWEFKQY